MADMNKLGMAYLTSNDPTMTGGPPISDERSAYLNQDMRGYGMSQNPEFDRILNALLASGNIAMAAQIAQGAPGLFKGVAAVPAAQGVWQGWDALLNHMQTRGTHPVQKRQQAWEMLLDAAQRPTQSTPFRRGDSY